MYKLVSCSNEDTDSNKSSAILVKMLLHPTVGPQLAEKMVSEFSEENLKYLARCFEITTEDRPKQKRKLLLTLLQDILPQKKQKPQKKKQWLPRLRSHFHHPKREPLNHQVALVTIKKTKKKGKGSIQIRIRSYEKKNQTLNIYGHFELNVGEERLEKIQKLLSEEKHENISIPKLEEGCFQILMGVQEMYVREVCSFDTYGNISERKSRNVSLKTHSRAKTLILPFQQHQTNNPPFQRSPSSRSHHTRAKTV
ncbi:MAG: hypothetical protein HRT90_08130 [Candidatus Margulisbacteria bacterium]|nr:hypothetical protein [Candidatus Margulisiibacteriota bacterium]